MLGPLVFSMYEKDLSEAKIPAKKSEQQGCIYYKLVDFFPQPGPTRVDFFPHFLFSFSVLHAHSFSFYGFKLVHSALKALTKP